jgi:diguanylate cyclase (GGDEF)-like protein
MAMGLLGVAGYSLHLEYMYGWTGVVRMAVHTGLGMIVLGIGLWNLAGMRSDAFPVSDGQEVAVVYRTASLLLLLIAASAGIGGFAFLQNRVDHLVRDELLRMAFDRSAWFEQNLRDRSGRAQLLADNEDLASRVRTLALAPQDGAALAALRRSTRRLHENGFSSVQVEVAGRRWQLAGAPTQPGMSAVLRGRNPGWLLWRDGYVLRRGLLLRDGAGSIGTLVTEQRLPALGAMIASANAQGDTGEMAVCASAGSAAMDCFPLRSRPLPSRLDRVVAGQARPMDYALHGKTGMVVASDYRNHRVLAAYRPIGDTGLGLVVKRDLAEIYGPIRRQFERIVLFLALLLGVGLWMMRRRLGPLLRALETTRAQARASSARFEAAVESNLDAFFLLECVRDAAGKVTDLRYALLNARGEHMLQRPRAEVIGHDMCELFPTLRSDGMLDDCISVAASGEPRVRVRESVVRDKRWLHMQLVKLGDGVGMTVRDITADQLAAERLRHEALHDPLTGVANRAGFELALETAMTEPLPAQHVVAVALLDLDGFKQVNDSLGHAAGDHLLQEVATRLRDTCRPSDTVARLGGDEFALVLSNIDFPDGAAVVCRKLVARLAEPMQLEGQQVAVTVSIGISAFPQDGASAAVLLKCADAAMYRSKRAGRNGYTLFGPETATPG